MRHPSWPRLLWSQLFVLLTASSAWSQVDNTGAVLREKTPAEIVAVFPPRHPPFTNAGVQQVEKDLAAPIQLLVLNEDFAELEAAFNQAAQDREPVLGGREKYLVLYDAVNFPDALHLRSPQARSEFCTRWLKAFPNSSTAAALRIDAQISHAWDARGTGYAGKVTDEGWEQFNERMKPIAGWIEEAEKQPIDNALYFAEAIKYAKAVGDPPQRVDELIRRAAQSPIRTYRAFAAAAEYYLPRWHGKPGDLERYAIRTYQLTKDAWGAEIYSQIVYATSQLHGESVFDDFEFSWPHIEQGYCDAAIRRRLSSVPATEFCWLACYAKRRETARALFEYLGDAGSQYWRKDLYHQARAWANRDTVAIGKSIFEFDDWTQFLLWGRGGEELYVTDAEGLHRLDLKANQMKLMMPLEGASWLDQSPDGKHWAIATYNGLVVLVDVAQGSADMLYQSPLENSIESLRFTPQGRIVARDQTGTLFSWRTSGDHDEQSFKIPGRPAAYESLSPGGTGWLTKGRNNGLALWDLTTGAMKQEWHLPPAKAKKPATPLPRVYTPNCVVSSPDGKLVLSSSRGKLQLWNFGEAAPRAEAEFGDGGISHAAFTNDGHVLTAMWRIKAMRAGDESSYAEAESEILLWDLNTLKVVKKYDGHDASVTYLAIAPDGKRFASSSHDGTVRLWTLP